MKQGMEAVRGLRYKLRMMGVQVGGPTYVYGDNAFRWLDTSLQRETVLT